MPSAETEKKSFFGSDAAHRAREMGRERTAEMALRVIDLQRRTFEGTLKGIGKLQDQTGKMLHRVAETASWVPDEGRQVVDEWNKATHRGREDFQKTMSKSFDLLEHYFKRVKSGEATKKAAPAAKKRAPAKKKATTTETKEG